MKRGKKHISPNSRGGLFNTVVSGPVCLFKFKLIKIMYNKSSFFVLALHEAGGHHIGWHRYRYIPNIAKQFFGLCYSSGVSGFVSDRDPGAASG